MSFRGKGNNTMIQIKKTGLSTFMRSSLSYLLLCYLYSFRTGISIHRRQCRQQ